ncbi:site-specific integrase [Vreelandella sulfidaeris]
MEREKATLSVIRYSLRTEKTYCYWIRFFIRFKRMLPPATMADNEVRQLLEYLTIERRVAAATQDQAPNAIVYLYRHVLDQPLGEVGNFSRAKCLLLLSLKK